MGKQDVKEKTIDPIKALQTGNMTTAQAQQMFNGVMPIGDYKGVASILDLDALVKQPLVLAEQKHILGILDGREADYDLSSISLAAGIAGTFATGSLTVPLGEVWYISTVQLFHPSLGAGNQGGANWYCSLWTDRAATPSAFGQPFHSAAQVSLVNSNQTVTDDFWTDAPFLGIGHKDVMLRAPGGTVF
ncbi:unnamed protein product, partial [marine sediment metagenome]